MLIRLLALPLAALALFAQTTTPSPQAAKDVEILDWRVRGKVFLKKLHSPQMVLETLPGAVFDHSRNYPHWGRGAGAFTKRFGSQYAQFAVGETIEMGVAAFHKEDPRYFRAEGLSRGARIKHAIVSVWVARAADGGNTIALGRICNVYGASAVAATWNPPDQRNAWNIFLNGTIPFGAKAGANIFREFWPDIQRARQRRRAAAISSKGKQQPQPSSSGTGSPNKDQ